MKAFLLVASLVCAACGGIPTAPERVVIVAAGEVAGSAAVSKQSAAEVTPIGTVDVGPQPTCTQEPTRVFRNVNNGKVDVWWVRLVNAVGYEVRFRRINGTPDTRGPFATEGNASINWDQVLPPGTWEVSVQGLFDGGCRGAIAAAEVFTIDGPPAPPQPPAPTHPTVDPNNPGGH